jgi:anti-sigma28 factor (negative regulator of flagellin synthesis)
MPENTNNIVGFHCDINDISDLAKSLKRSMERLNDTENLNQPDLQLVKILVERIEALKQKIESVA